MISMQDSERRYLVDLSQAGRVLAAAGKELEVEVHDRKRPVAYSRTLYLDSDDLLHLRSSEGAVTSRLRVRQYASAASLDEAPRITPIAYLEYKENAGPARRKTRLAAPGESLAQLLRGDLEDQALRRDVARFATFRAIEPALRNGGLRARLTTWYRRLSLAGDGVRVTLDEGLVFCPPVPPLEAGRSAEPASSFARGPGAVLEVKLSGRAPAWLGRATTGLMAASSFSKYQAGMAALVGKPRGQSGFVTLPLPVLHGGDISHA